MVAVARVADLHSQGHPLHRGARLDQPPGLLCQLLHRRRALGRQGPVRQQCHILHGHGDPVQSAVDLKGVDGHIHELICRSPQVDRAHQALPNQLTQRVIRVGEDVGTLTGRCRPLELLREVLKILREHVARREPGLRPRTAQLLQDLVVAPARPDRQRTRPLRGTRARSRRRLRRAARGQQDDQTKRAEHRPQPDSHVNHPSSRSRAPPAVTDQSGLIVGGRVAQRGPSAGGSSYVRQLRRVGRLPHDGPVREPDSVDSGPLPFSGSDLDAVAARLGQPRGRWSAQRLGYVSMLASTGGLWRVTGSGWGCVAKWVRAAPAYVAAGCRATRSTRRASLSGAVSPTCSPGACGPVTDRGPDARAAGPGRQPRRCRVVPRGRPGAPSLRPDRPRPESAAHALGAAHGTALARGAVPETGAPWATDSLSEWVTARLGRNEWLDDPEWDTSPPFGQVPAAQVHAAARRLFARTPADMNWLSGMPVVLCHHDFWPANIVIQPEPAVPRVVLLDWAHTGPGAPGADIGVMAATLIGDRYRPVDQFEPLLDVLTGAYLAGMANAGWTQGHDDVRTTAALTAPGRFLGYAAGWRASPQIVSCWLRSAPCPVGTRGVPGPHGRVRHRPGGHHRPGPAPTVSSVHQTFHRLPPEPPRNVRRPSMSSVRSRGDSAV